MPQEPLDLYIENLLSEANLNNLPQDYKDQYVQKIKEQINRRLGIIILENLNDDGLAEFSQLMAAEPKPNIKAIQEAFQSRIPGFDEKIRQAMVEFGKDFAVAAKK